MDKTSLSHTILWIVFLASQVAFIVFLIVSVWWRNKRAREAIDAMASGAEAIDFRTVLKRTPVPDPQSAAKAAPEAPIGAIGSAFPSWTADTPPHEILDVPESADRNAIEKAYRKLLKQYHPDRFAHWGKGYQTRAHHVIILIQKARDTMLARNM